MKTKKILFIFLLLIFLLSKTNAITETQAKGILGNHFITLAEARIAYPNLPNELLIPFSVKTLQSNPDSWLLPVKIATGFKYLLIQANFEFEACMLKKVDTLKLKTTEEILTILRTLRPKFPERNESDIAFKYFFRTKDSAEENQNIFRKAVSYDGHDFIVVNWPNKIEFGVVRQKCIFYLTKNKKGMEIVVGSESLPDYGPAIKDEQSIFVLTLFSHKTD